LLVASVNPFVSQNGRLMDICILFPIEALGGICIAMKKMAL